MLPRNVLSAGKGPLALALAVASLAGVAARQVTAEGRAQSSAWHDAGANCGPNALYVYLLLQGRTDVKLAQLRDIEVGPQGASLLALRDAAERFSVHTEIRLYPQERIGSVPLPAIIQVRNPPGSLTSNHFYVLCRTDKALCHLIDPTTAIRVATPKPRIVSHWTGYALVPRSGVLDFINGKRSWVGTFLAVFVGTLLVLRLFPARRAEREHRTSLAGVEGPSRSAPYPVTRLIPLILLGALAVARAGSAPGAEPWRCAKNGGINCLFCSLRVSGATCRYTQLERELARETHREPESALTLVELAARHGLALRAVSLNPRQLRSCPMPLVVYMDGTRPGSGYFCLLFAATRGWVDYVEGPSASLHKASVEDFSRDWSGVALLPGPADGTRLLFGVLGAAIGLALAGIIGCGLRWRGSRRTAGRSTLGTFFGESESRSLASCWLRKAERESELRGPAEDAVARRGPGPPGNPAVPAPRPGPPARSNRSTRANGNHLGRLRRSPGALVVMSRAGASLAYCALCAAVLEPTAAKGDPSTALPAGVRAQLEKAALAMATSHLVYLESRESVQETMNGETRYRSDINGDRFYYRYEQPATGSKPGTTYMEAAFDGRIVFTAWRSPTFSVVTKFDLSDTTDPDQKLRLIEFPYPELIGFHIPDSPAGLRKAPGVQSLVLHYLAQSANTKIGETGEHLKVVVMVPDKVLIDAEKVNLKKERDRIAANARALDTNVSDSYIQQQLDLWRLKQKLRPERTVAFELDPKKGYALVGREEWTADGRRIVRVEPSEWKFYGAGGLWLPRRCVATYFTFPLGLTRFFDKPVLTVTYLLKQATFGPRTGVHFELDKRREYRRPGGWIVERGTPEARKAPDHQVTYIVSADGAHLRRAASEAAAVRMSRGKRTLAVVALLFLLLPVLWLFSRKGGWTRR
jgi:Peptidase C39 family